MMFIREPGSDVSRHAEAMGCKRAYPLTGLCVECPFSSTCTIPRIPLCQWTARITHDLGRAEAVFYLNELTLSPIAKESFKFDEYDDDATFRTTALPMRCGDVIVNPDADPESVEAGLTIHLPTFLRGEPQENGCRKHVMMDARQVRYNQFSNYGRKAVLAVQTCGPECAKSLAKDINSNWGAVSALLRSIRVFPRRT